MRLEKAAKEIQEIIAEKKQAYIDASRFIWENPELAFQEKSASEQLISLLEVEGFTIDRGISGISTAFTATYGHTGPVIGILGEYDALPGLSQEAGYSGGRKEAVPGGAGHGCGHNLLGVGALAGAIACRDYLARHNIEAVIKFFGCPAEESGAAKMYLAKDGHFDGLDACLSWHPGSANYIRNDRSLAVLSAEFSFTGKAAHAASAPHLGRSALDAAELMSMGVNYLREHIIPEARIHYAYQDAGGTAPNIVQSHTRVQYMIRSPKIAQVKEIFERVKKVAIGASIMTETKMDVRLLSGSCDFIPNEELSQMASEAMEAIGGPSFSAEDRQIGQRFYDICSEGEISNAVRRLKACTKDAEAYRNQPLITDTFPYFPSDRCGTGSTDVGDASYACPTIWITTTCYANGTPNHSWQLTAQAGTSLGFSGMLNAAAVIALTGVIAARSPQRLKAARCEYIRATGGQYICPMESTNNSSQ